MKKKVIGIGGVFFKTEDAEATRAWYAKHLGIESEKWGAVFPWRRADGSNEETSTAWNPFKKDTTYFGNGQQSYMINYQVENLDELLATLRSEGVHVFEETDDSEFGKFGWILDGEGNRVELWQPPDQK
jgi:predicted enzyme related to lactoylglutathione lyase